MYIYICIYIYVYLYINLRRTVSSPYTNDWARPACPSLVRAKVDGSKVPEALAETGRAYLEVQRLGDSGWLGFKV